MADQALDGMYMVLIIVVRQIMLNIVEGDNGPCMHIWSTYEVRTVRITAGTDLGGPAVSTKVSACNVFDRGIKYDGSPDPLDVIMQDGSCKTTS